MKQAMYTDPTSPPMMHHQWQAIKHKKIKIIILFQSRLLASGGGDEEGAGLHESRQFSLLDETKVPGLN